MTVTPARKQRIFLPNFAPLGWSLLTCDEQTNQFTIVILNNLQKKEKFDILVDVKVFLFVILLDIMILSLLRGKECIPF
jgi:hypothetical protein